MFTIFYLIWFTLGTFVLSDNLHLATKGLLQVHPSFTGKGITLFPGHHPDHNADNLTHLAPKYYHELYYTQEGHRPAYHGAKHGTLKANFTLPTLVLDHSSHLRSVKCEDRQVKICFDTSKTFDIVQKTWNLPKFHLVTFHVGCGDELSGKRSYFLAQRPVMDSRKRCSTIPTTPINEGDAMDSGEITWSTYEDPERKKRGEPVLGHIRINGKDQFTTNDDPSAVNLESDPIANHNFFGDMDIDLIAPDGPADPDYNLPFLAPDGSLPLDSDSHNSPGIVKRRDIASPAEYNLEPYTRTVVSVYLEPRFLDWIVKGIQALIKQVTSLFITAVDIIAAITTVIIQRAIIGAKLIAVVFGVPFKHSYQHDFKFDYRPQFGGTNKPPTIFGIGDGFAIANSGAVYNIQCAKCLNLKGNRGDFSVDGRLAFSIQNGLTEGEVSFINRKPFTIDAQFGIEVEAEAKLTLFKKQLGSLSLGPFSIPGIVTFGPLVTMSVEVEATLSGQATLLVGGSYSLSPGVAVLSVVDKAKNKLEGLKGKFTPVAKLSGSLGAATLQIGLPIGIEVGLDVLNGKFKKTVALINKPAVYASAIVSHNQGNACSNGVELRVGIRNQIYVAAFDKWDYVFLNYVLWEKSLTCITSEGFTATNLKPGVVFNQVVHDSGGDAVGNSKPELTDVAATINHQPGKTGYRIIMDHASKFILVAGTDGYAYLVDAIEQYDVSAPWGTLDLSSNLVNLDVFGRIMGCDMLVDYPQISLLQLFETTKVPSNETAASFVMIKDTRAKDYQAYGIQIGERGKGLGVYYPTFCKTPKGLRLYPTKYLVDNDGNFRTDDGKVVDSLPTITIMELLFQEFFKIQNWKKNCRTIRLTPKMAGA